MPIIIFPSQPTPISRLTKDLLVKLIETLNENHSLIIKKEMLENFETLKKYL